MPFVAAQSGLPLVARRTLIKRRAKVCVVMNALLPCLPACACTCVDMHLCSQVVFACASNEEASASDSALVKRSEQCRDVRMSLLGPIIWIAQQFRSLHKVHPRSRSARVLPLWSNIPQSITGIHARSATGAHQRSTWQCAGITKQVVIDIQGQD